MSEFSEWNWLPLEELIEDGRPICYGVLKPGDEDPEGVPLIRIVDIGDGELYTENLFRISKILDQEFRRSRVAPGDLLLSIQGTIGRVAIVPSGQDGANISRTIARLSLRENACPSFYKHWLTSNEGKKAIDDSTVGSTRSSLNLSVLKKVAAPLPPDAEMFKVAELFDVVDIQIQKTEALIAKLEKVKEGLLHDLLTRGIDESGQLHPSPEQARELYKGSPLGLIPREWEVVHAEEVGEIVTGSTPPSNDLTVWGGDLPFFTPGDIAGYEPLQSAERTISTKGVRHVRVIPSRSTLVVCIGSTIGKVALTSCEGATNQQINAVIPSPAWDAYFVFQAIRNHIGQIHAWAGLQAVPIVNKSTFGRMVIPQPSATEQANISKAMRSLDVSINEERIKARKLSTEKAALMDDLLTGRVRVTSLLDQARATTSA